MPDRESLAVWRRATLGALLMLLVPLVAAACSGGASPTPSGTRIDVRLSNFAIQADKYSVPAGQVVFHVTNAGPSAHGLHIDRTTFASGALPIRKDNLSVSERAKGMHAAGSIAEVELNETRDLVVRLRPGHYVLWCNREGHYLGGMRTTLTVR